MSFSMMDAGMKVLSGSYPPLQVASLRCLASLPLILLWVAVSGGFRQVLQARLRLHLVRAALGIFMLASFAYGLQTLPLTEAYAIFFIAPLLITAFAAIILGERIEWRRWVAVVAGLGGVLIVLRPTGSGLASLAGVAVVACALGYALSAILVRILGRSDSTVSMVFWLVVLMGTGATLLAVPQWKPIQSQHWIAIAGVGLAGCLGQWAITEAFRIGEASFIAPFEYSALAWGVALDWLMWRTLPGPHAFGGAAIIIACGLYLIHRQRIARDEPQAAVPPDAVCE
jgi:drug/metabolite transporter (DMT)-like permease